MGWNDVFSGAQTRTEGSKSLADEAQKAEKPAAASTPAADYLKGWTQNSDGNTTAGVRSPVASGGSTSAGTTAASDLQNDLMSGSNSVGSRSAQTVGDVSGNNNYFDNSSGWFNNNKGSIANNWNFAASSGATGARGGGNGGDRGKEWAPMPDTGVSFSEGPYRPSRRQTDSPGPESRNWRRQTDSPGPESRNWRRQTDPRRKAGQVWQG
jgi:hypothetical protein